MCVKRWKDADVCDGTNVLLSLKLPVTPTSFYWPRQCLIFIGHTIVIDHVNTI